MAKTNALTEATDIEAMSNAAIARAFALRFPTLTLKHFHALRKGHAGAVVSRHEVDVCGTAAELLRAGILQPHMIPPGRKKSLDGAFSATDDYRGTRWSVGRIKGGRLTVWFRIMGDDADQNYIGRFIDDLPADHPLQMCHPRHWPFGDAREQRVYFESKRAEAREFIAAHLAIMRTNLGHMADHGFSVAAADRDRMRAIVDRCCDELLKAFDEASVVADHAPQLRPDRRQRGALMSRSHEGFGRGVRACARMLCEIAPPGSRVGTGMQESELAGVFRRGPQVNAVHRTLRQILARGDAHELEGFCAALTELAWTADQEPGANTGDAMFQERFEAFADQHERVLHRLNERREAREARL